jgi:hypothetical protein
MNFKRFVLSPILTILAFSFLLMSTNAWGNNSWYHHNLKSQDGVSIVLDWQYVGGIYEPFFHQRYELVNNLWINVHGNDSGLHPQDRVDVRLFNYRRSRDGSNHWELDLSVYLKLHWNGTNFTGQWIGIDAFGSTTSSLPIASEGALGNFEYRQEIEVTVYKNNTLYRLIDPLNGTPYFKFNLAEKTAP